MCKEPRNKRTPRNRQRFNALISADTSGNGCHIFNRVGANGYGLFTKIDETTGTTKTVSSHRFAYEQKHGLIPPGMSVLHKCDVRACCNERHLRLADAAENSADMKRKNRQSRFADRKPRVPLTETERATIVSRYKAGETVYRIAKDVGRNYVHVRSIVRTSLKKEQARIAEPVPPIRSAPAGGAAQYLEAA
jgi:hypothetical protein